MLISLTIPILKELALIKEVRLSNARAFKDKVWAFPMSDFSIFCGTNSAGKSTVLKAIQLLRQNLVPRIKSSTSKFKLQLSGQHIDLGNFTSFVSHEQTYRDLLVGISIESVLSSDSYSQLEPILGELEDKESLFQYDLDCDFKFGTARQVIYSQSSAENDSNSEEIDEVGPVGQEAILKEAKFSFRVRGQDNPVFSFSLNRYRTIDSEEPIYYLELPRKYFAADQIYVSVQEDFSTAELLKFRTTLRSLLPDRLMARVKQSQTDGTESLVTRPVPLPGVIEEIFGDIRIALNNVAYLGPLRAPAERYYTGQPDYNLASDTTGKALPYLIRDRIESTVFYYLPDKKSPIRQTLGEALNYWLFYLRTGKSPEDTSTIGKEIVVDTLEDVLVQFDIMSPDGSEVHALADSGFGYSQLLPIIARGLLMGINATLVVEQPEVHLNPALQIRISEFFISLALMGKQVIVETHSEHIVNYLRVRAAEDISGQISGSSTILYIDSAHGVPAVHSLGVKGDGSIPDWPIGFFGEAATLSARVLRAQRLHRTKEQIH